MYTVGVLSLLAICMSQHVDAQIVGQIDATLSHSFVVSTKTLSPGKYVFRVQDGSNGSIMTASSTDGKNSDDFMVRQSESEQAPAHTELIFRRYGNQEFLSKIYESGNRVGIAVAEPSNLEKKLQANGQQPVEHTESH